MGVVRYLAPDTDAYVASVQRHASRVRGADGTPARRPHPRQRRVLLQPDRSRLSGDDAADVFMSGPVLLWEHVGAGLVEPLDEHSPRTSWTSRTSCRAYWRSTAGPAGRATRSARDRCWSSPSTASPTTSPTCRKSWTRASSGSADVGGLLRGGRDVWSGGRGGPRVRAARSRRVAHDVHRVRDAAVELRRARLRPRRTRRVRGRRRGGWTAGFIEALREAGPVEWTNQRWYELALDFGRGRYALIVDSDHYVALFEDQRHSQLCGRIGYALPPPARPDSAVRICGLGRWR